MIKHESLSWWVGRILWPLLGGAWGAWLGFRRYFWVHLNADTFAPVFVLGIYAFLALIGLVAGAISCALIGGLVKKLLRYFGVGIITALSVATLVNVLALWQVGNFVQTKYPGLDAERAAKPLRSYAPKEPAPTDKDSYQNPCSEPPPTDTKAREMWELECR